LAIPFELRLVGLFVAGVCVGSLVNWAVYRLAWHRRAISPWSGPSPDAPPRRWYDRVPIWGWLGLRRESSLHGAGFWVRPMLVELLCGFGLAALYWWEVGRIGLLPRGIARPLPLDVLVTLHAQYVCHVVLMGWMLAGSLIDVDERIIPDTITVSGTLLGLLAAAVYPWSLLPNVVGAPGRGWVLDFLRLTSPGGWPRWLGGFPHAWPLVTALGCWWLWCAALMPRTWYSRHGWLRALGLLCARLRREASTSLILAAGWFGSAGILVVWLLRGPHWAGLLTSLVGMAASGGLVWAIRIIGTAALRREAMGFGDVTLMAMIGAFLGWQPCLIVFFLAPFGALLIGLASLVLRRGPEIFYGPFLCLAAAGVIIHWGALWAWAAPRVFALGRLIPLIILVCMILMALLLGLMRLVRESLAG
jgi:leader peptidase (prepilin peptidase)/N-methyltransferase